MRILVVGAGAIGGYFGARLLEAGRDVTFLVRPRRRDELAQRGLAVRSPHGDVAIAAPPAVLAEELGAPFDLVLVSCKAYDLEGAIRSLSPAVGPDTVVLPLLNGMRHMDVLGDRFGAARVLGGQCVVSVVLEPDGGIAHLNQSHELSFGEPDGTRSARVDAIAAELSPARFDSRASTAILQEMWDKWVFIATGACSTCLMRASVGDIVAAGATDVVTTLLAECAAIASHAGHAPGPAALERSRATFTAPGSTLTASMLRDIERGARTEADHVVGDLLSRGEPGKSPLLGVAYAHLRAYEARRRRG